MEQVATPDRYLQNIIFQMKKFDKIFFGLIFGAVLPVTFFFAGWWGTFKYVPENQIFIYAFGGLLTGIILDFFFLKKILLKLFYFDNFLLILIYIFYSVCCFGFFMGVPVFNALLGIPAGYYAARKCIFLNTGKENAEKYIKQTALFSTIVILFISVASATIALIDPFTSQTLKGMFGLNYEITKTILVTGIIIGGLVLICFQYVLTKFTSKIIYNRRTK
jgi:hypothetical protein